MIIASPDYKFGISFVLGFALFVGVRRYGDNIGCDWALISRNDKSDFAIINRSGVNYPVRFPS